MSELCFSCDNEATGDYSGKPICDDCYNMMKIVQAYREMFNK